jgi:hypothetical protein
MLKRCLRECISRLIKKQTVEELALLFKIKSPEQLIYLQHKEELDLHMQLSYKQVN